MTTLSEYCTKIRRWIDDDEPSDEMITEWVRDAEERINNELRVTEQVVRERATMDDNCIVLPDNWIETIYVRVAGGKPFNFVSNDSYWNLEPPVTLVQTDPTGGTPSYPGSRRTHYTHIGNTLFVWPPIDPELLTKIELAYYRKVTPINEVGSDPLMVRYPSIYRNCTLASGAPYLIEDERLSTWISMATAGITKANERSKAARHSGSPLPPMIRSFG
jgi:hypothetical protein